MSVLERIGLKRARRERSQRWDDLDYLLEYERMRWKQAAQRIRTSGDPTASFLTGTNVELIYSSVSAGTAKNTFTTEVTINDPSQGMGVQPKLPAGFFLPTKHSNGQGIRVVARGILGTTGGPTFTWTVRGGASLSTSAAILLGSAATTAATTVSTKGWTFEGDVVLESIGAAGANSTVRGAGLVTSPAGLASPFAAELWGGAAQPGTVATFDASIDNFINFNVACGTSNASNTITLLQLLVFGLN